MFVREEVFKTKRPSDVCRGGVCETDLFAPERGFALRLIGGGYAVAGGALRCVAGGRPAYSGRGAGGRRYGGRGERAHVVEFNIGWQNKERGVRRPWAAVVADLLVRIETLARRNRSIFISIHRRRRQLKTR